MEDLGLFTLRVRSGFQRGRWAWLGAYLLPNANVDRVFTLVKWLAWLFCRDDAIDHRGSRAPADWRSDLDERCIGILAGAPTRGDDAPLVLGLSSLLSDLTPLDMAWQVRFADAVRAYISATRTEDEYTMDRVPDFETYTGLRREAGAVLPSLYLTAGICDVPPRELRCAAVPELEIRANNHLCWVNDIASFAKELDEENPNNLLTVLQVHEHLSFDAALSRAVELCNAEFERFEEVARHNAVECGRYYEVLRWWIGGHLHWLDETERYSVPPPPADPELSDCEIAEHPSEG
jgi:hypothetical protein